MRRLRFGLETAAVGTCLAIAPHLPRSWLGAFGATVGTAGYLFDRRRRTIAMDNLRFALGDELTSAAARRLTLRCWRHFGRILMDTLGFPRFRADTVDRYVRYEGLEHLRAAYDRGRGVLLFSGHFGHWELMALMQGFLGYRLMVLARPLDNTGLERMLARLRSHSGNVVVHKRNGVREVLRSLRAGLGVAMLIDQDARGAGVFVPFFGRPASTTATLALLALRTGAPVLPFFSYPDKRGMLHVRYGPEIPIIRSDDRQADVVRLTEQCTSIVEQWIRRRPEYWLWMHRRWKTPPPPEPPTRAEVVVADRTGA